MRCISWRLKTRVCVYVCACLRTYMWRPEAALWSFFPIAFHFGIPPTPRRMHFKNTYLVWVYGYKCGGQRTTSGSWFFPSPLRQGLCFCCCTAYFRLAGPRAGRWFSSLPDAGITDEHHHTRLFLWISGSKPGLLHLYGQFFYLLGHLLDSPSCVLRQGLSLNRAHQWTRLAGQRDLRILLSPAHQAHTTTLGIQTQVLLLLWNTLKLSSSVHEL